MQDLVSKNVYKVMVKRFSVIAILYKYISNETNILHVAWHYIQPSWNVKFVMNDDLNYLEFMQSTN